MKSLLFGQYPALTDMLLNANIKLVDIGARGSALPQLVPLAPFAHYYACEPDLEEAERLKDQASNDPPWRAVTMLTEAIASRAGQADLHLTQHPGMSSLLEPDLGVANRFCMGSKFQVASVTRVPIIPLDVAAERYGFQDACFVKLDTQGTELDILQSGRTLLSSVLSVYTETLFHPFYKDQSLFADVDACLRGYGFSLFSLCRTTSRRASYRRDLYSRRVMVWAHCLYFREPASLPLVDSRAVAQLLGLALAFNHYDLAFELIDMGQRAAPSSEGVWAEVLKEVDSLVTRQTRRLTRKAAAKGAELKLIGGSARDNRVFD